ncbi:hypothetical protein, partial [Acinetobacter pittii]|uniref:hypothetical protein n=1 Tax=Acinetobacter pittii TaxID=48296 RepID=UPI00227CAC09
PKRSLVGWNHRDGHGSPQALRLPPLEGLVHPHRAELIAVIQGFSQARLAGHRQLPARTDAHTPLRVFNAGGPDALTPPQALDLPLWALYYGLRSSFDWVQVRWVRRNRLMPVHRLVYEHVQTLKGKAEAPRPLQRV